MFAASKSAKAATAAVATDTYFPYVPLLLEPTSTNGQQNNTFLDSSTNNFTITRTGTPTQGSVTPYWPNGYWGNYFDGSSNYSFASSSAFTYSTNNFTIEFWVNFNSVASGTVAGQLGTLANTSVFDISIGSAGVLVYSLSSTGVGGNLANGVTIGNVSVGNWYHVALVRNGSTFTPYLNGVAGTTTTSSSGLYGGTTQLYIAASVASNRITGYLSNFRVVNGTAVYTAAFTPPTTPLTAITNTSLLTCQSNRFLDNSTNAFAITLYGTPKVQAFQPFSPTASYTTAAYGGSGYFSGVTANSYLSATGNASTAMGTGDFTWECWVYPIASTNYQDFIDTRSNPVTGTSDGFAFTLNNNSLTPIVYTTSVLLTSSINVALNGWTHVALTRSGTTLTIWVNGVSGGTATNSTNLSNQSFSIGSANTSSVQTNGYISNLRMVKGTAVYTATFTPPTSPVTAITNTSLLLNYTNAGIYDAAVQNNVITVGDAQASTTQSKWSPTSMKFDGTGDWLTAIDSPQLQLGTGDFTIDGWFYLSATGAIYGMVSKGTATTGWSVNVTVLNKLQFSYTTSNLTGATTLSASTWYYFAVVRSGSATGNLKLYLNGTADATSGGAVTDNFNQTSILYVGADRVGATPLNGYLQDVRITKLARTITTPTAAFPTR